MLLLLFALAMCMGSSSAAVLPKRLSLLSVDPQPSSAPPGAVQVEFPASPAPYVPRPPGTPVVVPLFAHGFTSYDNFPFTYTPPAPVTSSSRIVLSASCRLPPGLQFDRSLYIVVANAQLLAGTTAEPQAVAPGPAWTVELDVSAYAALLALPATGYASLGTIVSPTYNSTPYCDASLAFYPGAPLSPQPPVVVPLGRTSSSFLSAPSPATPTAYSAWLEFVAQGQQNDEFFWSCVPDALSNVLGGQCNNTAARTFELFVDGQPVVVAPLLPFIFTGGIDPFLCVLQGPGDD